ncbi:hypothetical protein PU629_06135 [Pullulanibacillus sp. KACC 23026]|uniref:hypothetical protein n=1 Tax=Pullulanibacillus sp. KACC 23026 TaxID=3028315 RepID=UPI0023AEAABC|nr:hypothetical protein [Pullulanibacillus sp. KACC 23026]WEG13944.1 hypothetical protein PU629_06135 [Pullulanibacillus sp. KACC 23026]
MLSNANERLAAVKTSSLLLLFPFLLKEELNVLEGGKIHRLDPFERYVSLKVG